ncbi:MAG: right-handed parallel beta-helix repeat-containing protein, partial [Planctomycetaceae bacterium]|nr:right-handed parallel beta-helix repeat-containing protein [Planctomycetaceae bacterium]
MRKQVVSLAIVLAIAIIVSPSKAWPEALRLHVAVDGNDAWSGKLPEPQDADGPFRTVSRARDEVRKIKKTAGLPPGGIVVEVHGGDYFLASPLDLTADDSGEKGSPIVYRAAKGETVRLIGGVEVKNFSHVTDTAVLARMDPAARGKVVQADLKAAGVRDLGVVVEFAKPHDVDVHWAENRLEVFFQNRPMTLARWPNEGFVRIVDVLRGQPHNIHGIPGDKVGRFTYEGDRPSRWTGEKDIWLHGYWFWDWADQRQPVESIDTAKRVISIKPPYHSYGYRKGQWYYALNLLSELDSPGEWYLDRPSGILYFWPPAPLDQGKTLVSVLPSIVTIKGASHVTIERLGMEACRGTAVAAKDADDVHLLACDICNVGAWGAAISGRDSSVEGCQIDNCGDGGFKLEGGERKTITRGNLVADDNWIHDYGRWTRM